MNEVKVGFRGMGAFTAYAHALAQRLDNGDLSPEPSVFLFEDPETLFQLLTANRWFLLRHLRKTGPSSVRALAKGLGRDYRGVHADVAALREAGLIEKDGKSRVLVPWSKITAEMNFEAAA